MTLSELQEVLKALSKKRFLFHSEDDFKLSLALEIKISFPKLEFRLERPEVISMTKRDKSICNKRAPIDIVVVNPKSNLKIPIELKYFTKKLTIDVKQEKYTLTEQAARDIGRFNVRKDIYRLEKFIYQNNADIGYFILITNEMKYYKEDVSKNKTLESNFSIHQGQEILKDDKSWDYRHINKDKYDYVKNGDYWKYKNSSKRHWSCSGDKFYLLNLKKNYRILWGEYSKVNRLSNNEFKYCIIPVEK